MSYKYSKGAQVIGDLKAQDDTQRDTQIDFGEDQIEFETSGSVRMKITNSETIFTHAVHISGSEIEGLRLAKGGSDYKQIVFETDGADGANIQLSNAENLVIMNETNGKDIQFWTNPSAASLTQQMVIKEGGNIGIGTTSPAATLSVNGSIATKITSIDDGDSPYSITATDHIILADSYNGAITINLPAASSNTGRMLVIKDVGNAGGSNAITVARAGSDQIGGSTSVASTANKAFIQLVSDGDQNWHWIAKSGFS
tara:strand:+ start:2259 stop:3026 length:768 start_codon:yes stop_codon:yes gene_type:complete